MGGHAGHERGRRHVRRELRRLPGVTGIVGHVGGAGDGGRRSAQAVDGGQEARRITRAVRSGDLVGGPGPESELGGGQGGGESPGAGRTGGGGRRRSGSATASEVVRGHDGGGHHDQDGRDRERGDGEPTTPVGPARTHGRGGRPSVHHLVEGHGPCARIDQRGELFGEFRHRSPPSVRLAASSVPDRGGSGHSSPSRRSCRRPPSWSSRSRARARPPSAAPRSTP